MASMTKTSVAMRPAEVSAAARELAKMRKSLKGWLEYRMKNDQVATGQVPSKYPPALAAKLIAADRDWAVEQKLALQLHALLSETMPDADLPSPDVRRNPNAAPQLALLAIAPEQAPVSVVGPQAQGGFPMPPWPVIIVAAVALVLLTAIKSYADVAKEKEHYACIKAGACTDYGFWLKWGAVAFIGWFAWEKIGVGDHIKRRLAARSSR